MLAVSKPLFATFYGILRVKTVISQREEKVFGVVIKAEAPKGKKKKKIKVRCVEAPL